MFEQNLEATNYNESIQKQLNQICEPLKRYLGIQDFIYGTFYDNDRCFFIGTHEGFFNHILPMGRDGRIFQKTKQRIKESQYFFWPPKPKNDHTLEFYYATNTWHGCSIYKRKRNSMESWHFMPKKDKAITVEFYIKNMEILERFCLYFKDKASEFIDKAGKPLAYFECDITYIGEKSEQRERFNNATPIKKYHLSFDDLEITLTPQEFECLKYYAQGKSMKEIAQIKTLAPRTVEAHLEKVRRKTGCHRKSDLAKLYHTNFPSLIMP